MAEAAAQTHVSFDGLQRCGVAATSDENHRRCRVAAWMSQRISTSNETIEQVPGQIRQSHGQNQELIRARQSQFEGSFTRRAIIHLAVAKGDQGLTDDSPIRQTFLSDEDTGRGTVR